MTARPPDLADRKRPRGRFTIRWLIVLTLAIAGVLGIYAPELRSIDQSVGILFYSFAMADLVFVCFTPVWAVLLFFRGRARRGRSPGRRHYLLLLVGYLLSLILVILVMLIDYWLREGSFVVLCSGRIVPP